MQDIQPNIEKEKWLSVWGVELTSSEAQLFESLSALATSLSKRSVFFVLSNKKNQHKIKFPQIVHSTPK
jgi:hypothetical protein